MKSKFLVLVVLIILPALAQNTKDLYMPREYKKAYESETRSHDGTPGKNYFQNRTDYKYLKEILKNLF
jgi:hypothetical protein